MNISHLKYANTNSIRLVNTFCVYQRRFYYVVKIIKPFNCIDTRNTIIIINNIVLT